MATGRKRRSHAVGILNVSTGQKTLLFNLSNNLRRNDGLVKKICPAYVTFATISKLMSGS